MELQMSLASLFCTSMGMGQNLASFFVFQINYNKIPKSIHIEAVNQLCKIVAVIIVYLLILRVISVLSNVNGRRYLNLMVSFYFFSYYTGFCLCT